MKKLFLFLTATLVSTGMWATDFTFKGAYNATGSESWNTTTSTTPIVTVTKDISNGSVGISCVSGSNAAYPKLNGNTKYIKFSVPEGYRITNANVTWRANTSNQKIIAIFGESLSSISSGVLTATNGGYVISNALSASGNTTCDGGEDFAISASHNAREVIFVRIMTYKKATYVSANTKYASFPCKFTGSTSDAYPDLVGNANDVNIGKIILTVEATTPSCTAPAAPTITGEATYTEGGTITLVASCASGADESTTYTWYKGDTWEAAKATTPVQAASTTGSTFTKTAALNDAGTYWCEAANSSCTSHNAEGKAITVNEVVKDYTVTAVTSTGDDTYGTVAAAVSSLDEGETTTITATPAANYRVANWAVSGEGASISPAGASHSLTTTLTMGTADATVTVTFEAIPTHTVTATVEDAKYGSAVAAASPIQEGATTTITATPAKGYQFARWEVSGEGATLSSNTTNPTTLTMGTENATVTAIFEEKTCPTSGEIFSLTMKTGLKDEKIDAGSNLPITSDYGTVTGGSATLYNAGTDNTKAQIYQSKLYLGGGAGYVLVELECPLKASDKISFTGGSNQICFTLDNTRVTTYSTSSGEFTVTSAFLGESEDVNTFYIWRNSNNGTSIATLTITRPSAPTALDNTEEEVKAVKFFKDGQLFIEKNGHVYNVFGACVK